MIDGGEKRMWKMKVWFIKGGWLAGGEAQGPVVVWPGDLFAVFSTPLSGY